MRDTKARLTWLASLIRGPRVLELGPSRGLFSAFLARSGHSIIRVCADERGREQAERELATETKEVRGHVLVVDSGWLSSEAAAERRCDSAIACGLLENLAGSYALLDRLSRMLVEGGRLALAFPFSTGELAQPERARRVAELLGKLGPGLELTRWEVVGGWLGATALRRESEGETWVPEPGSASEATSGHMPGPSEIARDVEALLTSDPRWLEERLHMPWPTLAAREHALRAWATPQKGNATSTALVPAQGTSSGLETSSQEPDPGRRIRELEAQVRRLEWKCSVAERRVEQNHSTISFRLGQALIQAFKSWRGLLALPRELSRIRRDARLRRANASKYSGARIVGFTLHPVLLSPGAPASAMLELSASPITLVFAYHPSEGAFSVIGHVDGEVRSALVRIEYLDARRRAIPGQHPGLVYSPRVGAYRYLTTGDQPKSLFFVTPPESCRYVQLGFQLSPGTRFARISNAVSRTETRRVSIDRTVVRRRGPPTPPAEVSPLRLEAGRVGWPTPGSTNLIGQRRRPTVLAVLDEFTTSCFAPDCVLVRPRPDNWQALAEQYRPELVLIESAWKGNGGSWQYRVGSYTNCPGDELAELVNFARYHCVPVVFWNKEDPV
ncbi:MAG: class I SAM-dependent methyltransferase, partial [Polyangiaceae bacterium]|nr:class I SAM-dependent methyltransferase [Polyangiaceae bacterium]